MAHAIEGLDLIVVGQIAPGAGWVLPGLPIRFEGRHVHTLRFAEGFDKHRQLFLSFSRKLIQPSKLALKSVQLVLSPRDVLACSVAV